MDYYTLEELQTHEFDDKEINSLFEDSNFIKLCISNMFNYIGIHKSMDEICEIIKHDSWMKQFKWTWKEHDNFIIELSKVYKNIYQYSKQRSYWYAEQFVFKYGFNVKDNKKNESKHFKNLLKYK